MWGVLQMKFEEALTKMREGAKINHPSFEENVYFMACRVGLVFFDTPLEDMPISIVKMKGDCQHIDMFGGAVDDMIYPGPFQVKPEVFEKPCKHGYSPQINLFLVMSDEWQIIE